VIGVVADVRQRGVSDDELAAMYMPTVAATSVRQFVVRTTNELAPLLPMVRQTIEGHDMPMFVTATTPLRDLVDSTIVVERSRALLSGLYGMVALLLASVGLYGLAARLVAERRREIGIRVALGAGPRNIRRLVMADAWMIVGIGLVAGVPAAMAASRFAQGMLYGVAPAAPHVLVIAALALAMAAITATIVPAWRANRIDPAVTLREE
jgi:ABC-type antimicrobial peptide transport system permease subunit